MMIIMMINLYNDIYIIIIYNHDDLKDGNIGKNSSNITNFNDFISGKEELLSSTNDINVDYDNDDNDNNDNKYSDNNDNDNDNDNVNYKNKLIIF